MPQTLTVGGSTLDVGLGLLLSDFSVNPDSVGGTLVIEAPCYVAGTRILSEHGEVAVEALRPGDRVRTANGRLAPVKWVGRTRVDLVRHPAAHRAAPVRLAAGAIARGVPRRDLLLSPGHALLVGGALVPAQLLVNGATIRVETTFSAVTYVHVELDRHDLLLAEGLPAESYLDTGNRALFTAEIGVRALFPDLTRSFAISQSIFAERGCAVLLLEGPRLVAAKRSLLSRATDLGHAMTDDPRPEGAGGWPRTRRQNLRAPVGCLLARSDAKRPLAFPCLEAGIYAARRK